ncbi:hypothetical protein GCM10027275_40810 [Rhabdobacter roseus]|uniref:Ferric-dicitrate binding protein FerR (Iron transport regulator) n=1 Tax=Rhabdobacter roseus TaxID=1655419 RepID=A0A840TT35_9BACT|nr:hypothetical protein [Rhabdobacter roseus]MBB5286055.1 ferric-dicitrate binding protein FerR (iron transport regulator) [Rhabdobacter roseus]
MNKKWTEQALQELYETDRAAFEKLASENEDARFYQLLFTTLPQLETAEVPATLAESVLNRLEVKEAKSNRRQAIGLALLLGLLVLAGLGLVLALAPQVLVALGGLTPYLALMGSSVVVFFGIEWLDQRVVWRQWEEG